VKQEIMRLIDANALVKSMEAFCNRSQFGRSAAKICIKNAPTIDPERHRYWMRDERTGQLTCSECGSMCSDNGIIYIRTRYCPNCGCKMDLDEKRLLLNKLKEKYEIL
jgi:hypothetical protein